MVQKYLSATLFSALAFFTSGFAFAGDDLGDLDKDKAAKVFPAKPIYSPYAGRNFPTRPFFGDTHLHTAASFDAGAFGARLGPRDAYRLARGEEITSNSGQPVKLSRPLDFLVVADHSDNMGMFPDLFAGKPELLADPTGRKWYDMIKSGQGAQAAIEIIMSFSDGTFPKALVYAPGTRGYRNAWMDTIAAADQFNDPGRFTAFIGYEWTSNTGSMNLHRNVIFRDNGDRARQVEPFTTMRPQGSDNPVDLWKWMDAYEKKTGGSVLAIAHNGNLSNGLMFPVVEAFGKKLDREYAETRAKWERLYETTQTKGTGESHPYLSPNDEFADFEIWDKGNLDGSAVKKKEMLEFEYARSALKNGLELEQQLGTNPYKFGLIGSSDAHTGLAAMEEDNFFGKTAPQEPSAERMRATFFKNAKTGVTIMDWEVGASGYAAVWATENTREAIWDAMERKETYATTGPRMIVRFFGGWDFAPADAHTRSPAVVGYSKGVPMGGDLSKAPAGQIADVHRRCTARSDRRQSRPHPDRQGLARCKGRTAREDLRRRLGRRSQARCGRQGAFRWQHSRCGQCNLDQHHRRIRVDCVLERPGLQCRRAGVLLRSGAGDPHAALDRLRREALRYNAVAGHAHDHHRAGLHLAHLVHARLM